MTMHLTPAMQALVLHWGEMGAKWGTNRSVAQIHALLHLSPEPLPADEIAQTLGIARSNVSTGLKELQTWKLVRVERQLGDRRDHFTSICDMMDLAVTVIEERRSREFVPTMEAVRAAVLDAEGDQTPPPVRARMQATLETMDLFDQWYLDIAKLPRSVQLTLAKMGARIARLVPKG